MKTPGNLTRVICLILALLLQTGCGSVRNTGTSTAGPNPTMNLPVVTVSATQTSAIKPTATPVPLANPTAPSPSVVPTEISTRLNGATFGAFMDAHTSDNGLTEMMAAGVSWVHLPFAWKAVEPYAGARNWAAVAGFENNLRTAASHQMNVIIYLQDTPGWAIKAGFGCGAVAKDKLPDLGRFLTDMVARYSAPPYNVSYFELWSEPEVDGFLGCWGDPKDLTYFGGGYYAEMLKTAYPIIKAVSPTAQVLFGGLLLDCDPALCKNKTEKAMSHFLDGALANGAGNYFDGISFHAYDYYMGKPGQYYNPNWDASWDKTGPVFLVKTAYLRLLLDEFHVSDKYLMNTELAMLCGSTGLEAPCVTPDHEKTLASYLVQGYIAGIADDLRANIWFSVAGWRGTALLDGALKPLPSLAAFKNARAQLGTATYVKTLTEFDGVRGFEFKDERRKIWVLWAVSGDTKTVSLGVVPQNIFDVDGSKLSITDQPEIGEYPVFVQFNP